MDATQLSAVYATLTVDQTLGVSLIGLLVDTV